MRNYLEDKEILSDELIAVIDILTSRSKKIVFGGSIALNAVGLLNRKVKDIDIIIYNESAANYFIDDFICATEDVKDVSETTTDINGDAITRIGARVNGINICIFKLLKIYFSEINLFGRTIRIQNVNDAILAKRAYAEKDFSSCDKHRIDLKEIESVLDDLPF